MFSFVTGRSLVGSKFVAGMTTYSSRSNVKLELPCPQTVQGITLDPEPDWSFDALLSELNVLELKLNESSKPFSRTTFREPVVKSAQRSKNSFVMRVLDDEMEDLESDDEVTDPSLVSGRRFTCDELYLSDSDDSEYELAHGDQIDLMDKVGSVEGALFELTHEHQLGVTEEIRNQISALETDLMSESEKSTSAIVQVEKYRDARREMDRKLDIQYQRKIAEALDKHLTAIQQDHEIRSQIEERRIRTDAEEVKRKEKAHQEKLRQEKAKAEAEAAAAAEAEKKRAEEAKKVALEAERKEAEEVAKREAAETSKRDASEVAKTEAARSNVDSSPGQIVMAAESALKFEQGRLQLFKELDEKNQALTMRSNQEFSNYGKQIDRLLRQISGSKDNVRAKANNLLGILNDPRCPRSILAEFAKKTVFQCERPSVAHFALGHVIVLVTSQLPDVMDLLLAAFHTSCIYTVPKHIKNSKSAFASIEAYRRSIGYREINGTVESREEYLKRLESYMKLYGALVQTEIEGFPNRHGLQEGWAWVARFLNYLPPNKYTAVALKSFLEMAGFGLFRKYKSQFKKILRVIDEDFLVTLKKRSDPDLGNDILTIQSYIADQRFCQEPEGRRMVHGSLLSREMTLFQER